MAKAKYRHVVPETYVQLLYDYLEARGHSPETLLGAPAPDAQDKLLSGVDVGLWEQLLKRAADQLSDPLIGLHIASTVTSRHLGVLGALVMTSDNMGTALKHLNRYLRLVFDVVPMVLRFDKEWVEITWDESDYETGWLVSVTGQAVLVQYTRTLMYDGETNPQFVAFRHEEPDNCQAYEDFFGCPVYFNRPEVVMRFSAGLLNKPLKNRDPELLALLEQHAERLLDQLPQEDQSLVEIRKAIAKSLREREPDIEQVSEYLGCSSRTTQRRLQQSGTNFRTELNVVRHELAVSYLRDPRLQIVDIALLLGYSEHSAFTRAFREWTGKTPKQVRSELI